jgi:hypothetical protein
MKIVALAALAVALAAAINAPAIMMAVGWIAN